MEHLIKDGIAFTLTNGSIIPLEYNRSVTFYKYNARGVLGGLVDSDYRTSIMAGTYEHLHFTVDNFGGKNSLERMWLWYSDSSIRSVQITPRGWERPIVYDLSEVASIGFYYVSPTPKGIAVVLRDGRRAMVDENQTFIYYGCKPDRVAQQVAKYAETKASWDNPIALKLPYSKDVRSVIELNRALREGIARTIQIKLVGDATQMLYPTDYFIDFQLV